MLALLWCLSLSRECFSREPNNERELNSSWHKIRSYVTYILGINESLTLLYNNLTWWYSLREKQMVLHFDKCIILNATLTCILLYFYLHVFTTVVWESFRKFWPSSITWCWPRDRYYHNTNPIECIWRRSDYFFDRFWLYGRWAH